MKRAWVAMVLLGCSGLPPVEQGEVRPTKGPKIALLNLEGGLPEKSTPGLLSVEVAPAFDELLSAVESIEKDPEVRGVFVSFDSSLGLVRALETGRALGALRKAGKPVHCHAHGLDNGNLVAATLGCDVINLSPAGEVSAVGLAAQVTYMRQLLVDELKVTVDMLQVGKFKGAAEPLTRDGPSEEARASLMGVLSSFRGSWKSAVHEARGAAVAEALELGPYSPQEAKTLKLIDVVGYRDDALRALEQKVDATRREVVLGKDGKAGRDAELAKLVKTLAGADASREPVALVKASGSITMSESGGLFSSAGITERELGRVVRKLRTDDSVKAVVLRIDSPGGSALASDLLWHDLMALREKKPIVVSVGDMAASGGYYLASTANWIVASELSLVGSIGVVGGKVSIGSALERFGLHTATFPANPDDPNAASRAAYLSPMLAWEEPVKARVQSSMEAIYDLFLARVAEGRKIPVEKVAASAEGRVWSALQGQERGLVDEIGGLSRALAKARELAGLPADAGVRKIGERPAWLEALGDGESQAQSERTIGAMMATELERHAGLPRSVREPVQAAAGLLSPLLAGEHAICISPYLLQIR